MYTVRAYYVAKIFAELPILTITPMLFTIVIYFKIGLAITASQFFYFFLILFLLVQCAASFGYFLSSIFDKGEIAVQVAPVVFMPILLFGGMFANSGDI